jgi:hypothetical protein
MTVAGIALADPRVVLIHEFVAPRHLDARANGRAWVRGSAASKEAFVVGPGDRVERLPDPTTPPWPGSSAAQGGEAEDEAEGPPKPPPGQMVLAEDGSLQRDGARAPLSEGFLRALGPKIDRRALAYDKETHRYVLLRSRRPLAAGNGYDDHWSIVWFEGERILGESMTPDDVDLGPTPPLAASNGVVWVGVRTGVLRWDNSAWTLFYDEKIYQALRTAEREGKEGFVVGVTAFTLGNAAASSAFSVPISLGGHQRFLPTATTTLVGSVPSVLTSAMFAIVGNARGGNDFTNFFRALAVIVGTLSLPVVALTTYGTGELAFDGTNGGYTYLGALGGAAAGAAVWTLVSAALPEQSFRHGWWWVLPAGAAFIGASSTTGYLWAGDGFRKY